MISETNQRFANLASIIRERKTLKVLSDPQAPVSFGQVPNLENEWVLKSIAEAGWAPFHYDRNLDGLAEPWRCHVIWHTECRTIAKSMSGWFSDMKPTNKLPSMLASCGALVLVTWLPQTSDDISDSMKLATVNEEHLAATAAMVQNLLLLLTAAGFGTYWSSGGQFRTSEMFKRLNVPLNEKLSAAVFVEYPESQTADLERLPGKNRSKRSEVSRWTRVVELPD